MAQINKPSEYFNTVTYAGNSATQSITGVNFQPDLVWLKPRSVVDAHRLMNSVSGAGFYLMSNATNDESASGTRFTSFDADGFTLGDADEGWNQSGQTYASWNWKAGGTASSNTDGDITSSVSASTTSGFSVVSYTGNATAGATVGHGLGIAPDVVICKQTGGVNDWMSYHSVLGNTKSMRLNATNAVATSTTYWNDTSPTSTVFSLGSDTKGNASSTMIAYCFAEKKGFSKFGSYVGNGSTDGTFIYTGFKPAYFVIKRTDTTENWYCTDNKRNPINPVDNELLLLNKTDATITSSYPVDFLSNGFKIRGNNNITNASGGTYIYMAFAENPFVTSTGIPTPAR